MTETKDAYAVWSFADDGLGVEVRFVGRGPDARPRLDALVDRVAPAAGLRAAWMRQTHSALVVEAAAGLSGEGDVLLSAGDAQGPGANLALFVLTADCVPILLASPAGVAAVHAGWRGLAAGVVGNGVHALRGRGAGNHGTIRAWIGPAIGRCCYEVGADVARLVAAASEPSVVHPRAGARPTLDLVSAAKAQLVAAGVAPAAVANVDLCTRCHPDLLWSYRRDGEATGRNEAMIWRRRR